MSWTLSFIRNNYVRSKGCVWLVADNISGFFCFYYFFICFPRSSSISVFSLCLLSAPITITWPSNAPILPLFQPFLWFLPSSHHLSRRDLRVPLSVCRHLQGAHRSQVASPEAEWLQKSSWSAWSATRRRWFVSVGGTSARGSAPARASPRPPSPPNTPPPPPPASGCLQTLQTRRPAYVSLHPHVAAADTGRPASTHPAAKTHCNCWLHNNPAGKN